MVGSLLLRFGLVLGGFYFLARYAGWPHVLAAAIGFTVPRLFLVHRVSLRRNDTESEA
jgi:F1F0 ATPase subunit 2